MKIKAKVDPEGLLIGYKQSIAFLDHGVIDHAVNEHRQ